MTMNLFKIVGHSKYSNLKKKRCKKGGSWTNRDKMYCWSSSWLPIPKSPNLADHLLKYWTFWESSGDCISSYWKCWLLSHNGSAPSCFKVALQALTTWRKRLHNKFSKRDWKRWEDQKLAKILSTSLRGSNLVKVSSWQMHSSTSYSSLGSVPSWPNNVYRFCRASREDIYFKSVRIDSGMNWT